MEISRENMKCILINKHCCVNILNKQTAFITVTIVIPIIIILRVTMSAKCEVLVV